MTGRMTGRMISVFGAAALALGSLAVVTAGGPAAAASKPVKIILLAETQGESSAAVPYYANGAQLAAKDLGSKVEYSRIPAPLSPAQAQTALLQALDQHPDAIIGLPAASQVIPLSSTIEQAGIPFFALTSSKDIIKTGANGAPNLYNIRPLADDTAIAVANYVTKDLGKKKIGLVCVQNAVGTDSCNDVRTPLASNGAKIVAERTNSTTATDLTDVAVAMKDADAILDFNFPNPLGVLANQLVQNGVDIPHIATISAGVEATAGVVKGEALKNLRGVDECAPQTDKSAAAKKFVAAYRAAYNAAPIYSAVEVYDVMHLIVAAAQKAGSTSPTKLRKAIDAMSYKGICATYHPDAGNVLVHTAGLMKWDDQGVEHQVKAFTFAPIGTSGSSITQPTGGNTGSVSSSPAVGSTPASSATSTPPSSGR
jgi:ABC-type branched-subunit amino acid transport system substrate-binding protein